MAKIKYDVVAVTGTYQDPNTGQEKKKYVKCGKVIENDKGFSLILEVIPVNSNGWFNFYEPKNNSNGDGNGNRQNDYARKDDVPPF